MIGKGYGKKQLGWRREDADEALYFPLFKAGYQSKLHLLHHGDITSKWDQFVGEVLPKQEGFIGFELSTKSIRVQRGKYKEAWLYEFTFKPDIRCLYVENSFYGSSVYILTKNSYDRLKRKNIDMITRGSEYLLINTDKISSFKPVKKWTLSPGENVGDIIDL